MPSLSTVGGVLPTRLYLYVLYYAPRLSIPSFWAARVRTSFKTLNQGIQDPNIYPKTDPACFARKSYTSVFSLPSSTRACPFRFHLLLVLSSPGQPSSVPEKLSRFMIHKSTIYCDTNTRWPYLTQLNWPRLLVHLGEFARFSLSLSSPHVSQPKEGSSYNSFCTEWPLIRWHRCLSVLHSRCFD